MTDAEKELRRLAEEATPGPWFSKMTVLALLDRIEALEKQVEARTIVVADDVEWVP